MDGTSNFYYQQAMELFQQAYERQMQGKLDEAIEGYRESIELCPTAEAHTYLGWAYSMQKRYPEAIEECRKAIEIDPDFGNPYNDIGAYLIESGKWDDAMPWLEKAVLAKRYDAYCYPHYNMGRIWEQKGDWDKALRCYRNAVKENAQYTLARKAVNRVLSMLQ